MSRKQFLWIPVVAASALAIASVTQLDSVSAQQSGEAGVGGAGGAGGAGGGGGGRGGFDGGSGNGALTAYGDYVYVLRHGILYQYAAYDLTLVKKSDLSGNGAKNRVRRGQAGGRGGDGGAGGVDGGQGGDGGAGGGSDYGGNAFGRSEDVAAYGEFVYVLQGKTLRKLYADGLKPMKAVQLDFDAKAEN